MERKLWEKGMEVKEWHCSEEVNKIIENELDAKQVIEQLTNEKNKIMDFLSYKINQINSEFRGECSKVEDSKEGKLWCYTYKALSCTLPNEMFQICYKNECS